MALYEKRNKMPSYLAEIPYGFKNQWAIEVSLYNLSNQTFNVSDVISVNLNGYPVTVEQMLYLFDYERDTSSLTLSGAGSGIFVTLTKFNADKTIITFRTLVSQDFSVTGVTRVSGDMVDNTNPQNPIVLHDTQKLDVSLYNTDKTALNTRLTENETKIQNNINDINTLKNNSVTAINVNSVPQPITNGTANISIDAITQTDLNTALNTKVDKTVAGTGNTIVQTATDSFDTNARTLNLNKTLLSLETGTKTQANTNYALADLLGITALEAIDKELYYFTADSNISTMVGTSTIALSNLHRFNADGTTYVPTSTDNIHIIYGIATEYSGIGISSRNYISSIGTVISATASTLTCIFTNLRLYNIYNKYNGYRGGTIVYDSISSSLYYTLQRIPVPTAEANIIPLTNNLYYQSIKDDSLMPSGTIWGNFDTSANGGQAYSMEETRLKLLDVGQGYDNYVSFLSEVIPVRILTEQDWDSEISLWVTDGLQFTSLGSLLDYYSNFANPDRYVISNNGIIQIHYETGSISIISLFTITEISNILNFIYQPILSTAISGNLAIYDNAGKLVDSGVPYTKIAEINDIKDDINNINGQITDIGNDINNIEADITELHTDVDDVILSIVEIETNINDIDGDVSALDDRITAAETDIAEIDGKTDDKITAAKSEIYRNTTNALITTTKPADLLTIQPNPNDTSFHAMTIYGDTTQDGTPAIDDPVPLISVTNPIITVSNGIDTQSLTLDGITLNSIGDLTDTIEIKNGEVTLTQYAYTRALDGTESGVELYLTSPYQGFSYTPTSPYAMKAQTRGVGMCSHLPTLNVAGSTVGAWFGVGNGKIYFVRTQSIIGSTVADFRTWLASQYNAGTPLTVAYPLTSPIITDMTNTALGQALLAACKQGGTMIQVSDGTISVKYNRSIVAAFDDELVQSVQIAPGTTNGTITYGINNGAKTEIAVKGLNTAAYTPVTNYATSAQGAKADTALQSIDVIDNLTSTITDKPLSANQGRVLEQLIESISSGGKPIGGFGTYADAYTNTSDYSADLQPININDTMYIVADENHTDMPTQYKVAAIDGSGNITYSFVRILPDSARDFNFNPIQTHEIEDESVTSDKIQFEGILSENIAPNAVTNDKLSNELQTSITKADNSFQVPLSITGAGNFVADITINSDNTLTVEYTNTPLTQVQTQGTGDFVTDINANGDTILFNKNGTALTEVEVTGTGNVITEASATTKKITLTKGTMIQDIVTNGTGNVITDISAAGIATKGTMLKNIAKSGTGNVISGVSVSGDTATLATTDAVTEITTSGSGDMVSNVTLSGKTLQIMKAAVPQTVGDASTSQKGIVQLNDTLTSTSVTQALTANQGKMLNDKITTNDAAYVKLSGNQTITGTKTFSSHPVAPSKTTLPVTPSATQYATESQVNTRIAKPTTAVQNNIAVWDGSNGLVDSGVPYTAIDDIENNLSDKQAKITANGILKGNGSTVTAAVAGTDYATPTNVTNAVNTHNNAGNAHEGLFNSKLNITIGNHVPSSADNAYGKLSELWYYDGVLYTHTNITSGANEWVEIGTGSSEPPIYITNTLTTANWVGSAAPYSYTLSNSDITADSDISFSPAPDINAEQLTEWAKCGIICYAQANGSVTIRALMGKPTIGIPVSLKVYEVG